jgi:hypothetical protein
LDLAWVVFKLYKTKNDQVDFSFFGSTKNTKKENIKYELYDINLPDDDDVNSDFHKKIYEDKILAESNAFNIAVISQSEKINGEWKTDQFVKKHFPLTFFLSTNTYENCNTILFDQNILTEIGEPEYSSELIERDRVFKNPMYRNINGINFDAEKNTQNTRGYIQYYTQNTSFRSKYQFKFVSVSNSPKEELFNAVAFDL